VPTVYVKSEIVYMCELCKMFQRYITVIMETSIQRMAIFRWNV